MNKKQLQKMIETGETVAVVESTADWARRLAVPGKVKAVGVERKFNDTSGRWYVARTVNDGVRVEVMHKNGEVNVPETWIVRSQQVISTWEEHQATQDAIAKRKAAEQDRKATLQQRAAALSEQLGISVHLNYQKWNGQPDGTVTVSLSTLENLAKEAKQS